MIPAGLAAAVAAGALGALAAGALLAPERSGEIAYVEGASITVGVSERDVRSGEPVELRIVNSGSVRVDFDASTFYGLRVTQLDGIIVFAPEAAGGASLGAREEASVVWSQQRDNGSDVHPGTYRVLAEGTGAGGHAVRDSVTVTIRG